MATRGMPGLHAHGGSVDGSHQQEDDMANSIDDRRDEVPPKGGHASANPEPVTPAGHAQRHGEGASADDELRDAGDGGGPRSDAARSVADEDRDGSGGGTGSRQQGGGSQGEGMG